MQNILKYYLSQQQVPRNILEKVFINKKFTQGNTSLTLKIDVFKTPGSKNIENYFQNINWFSLFLNQANSCSDSSQYW